MTAYGFRADITLPIGTIRVETVAQRMHIPIGLEVTTEGKRTSGGTSVFKGRFTGRNTATDTDTYEIYGTPEVTPYPCEATYSVEILGDQP
jgi:hypothetical protein